MAVARGLAAVKTLTPTLDTSAYASGDVLFQPTEIVAAVAGGGTCSIIESVHVNDLAAQGTAIDLYFMSRNPASSIGANNAALAITDADLTYCVGKVSLGTSDYQAAATSGATNGTFTKLAVGLLIMPETVRSGSSQPGKNSSTSLWVFGVVRSGTPTYGASDLVIKIGLLQE